jgi:hypothetical protein
MALLLVTLTGCGGGLLHDLRVMLTEKTLREEEEGREEEEEGQYSGYQTGLSFPSWPGMKGAAFSGAVLVLLHELKVADVLDANGHDTGVLGWFLFYWTQGHLPSKYHPTALLVELPVCWIVDNVIAVGNGCGGSYVPLVSGNKGGLSTEPALNKKEGSKALKNTAKKRNQVN